MATTVYLDDETQEKVNKVIALWQERVDKSPIPLGKVTSSSYVKEAIDEKYNKDMVMFKGYKIRKKEES